MEKDRGIRITIIKNSKINEKRYENYLKSLMNNKTNKDEK